MGHVPPICCCLTGRPAPETLAVSRGGSLTTVPLTNSRTTDGEAKLPSSGQTESCKSCQETARMCPRTCAQPHHTRTRSAQTQCIRTGTHAHHVTRRHGSIHIANRHTNTWRGISFREMFPNTKHIRVHHLMWFYVGIISTWTSTKPVSPLEMIHLQRPRFWESNEWGGGGSNWFVPLGNGSPQTFIIMVLKIKHEKCQKKLSHTKKIL